MRYFTQLYVLVAITLCFLSKSAMSQQPIDDLEAEDVVCINNQAGIKVTKSRGRLGQNLVYGYYIDGVLINTFELETELLGVAIASGGNVYAYAYARDVEITKASRSSDAEYVGILEINNNGSVRILKSWNRKRVLTRDLVVKYLEPTIVQLSLSSAEDRLCVIYKGTASKHGDGQLYGVAIIQIDNAVGQDYLMPDFYGTYPFGEHIAACEWLDSDSIVILSVHKKQEDNLRMSLIVAICDAVTGTQKSRFEVSNLWPASTQYGSIINKIRLERDKNEVCAVYEIGNYNIRLNVGAEFNSEITKYSIVYTSSH